MHIIQAHTPSVTLFTNVGEVRTFKSLAAAKKALGIRWITANVGEHFCTFTGFEIRHTEDGVVRTPCYSGAFAIMRDDLGTPITAFDFYALDRKPFVPWWLRRYGNWNGEGPVPGVSKPKAGRHYYRSPATMSERRLAQSIDPDEPGPRPSRNKSHLPTNYDDLYPNSRRDRSWKGYRKQKWKSPKG